MIKRARARTVDAFGCLYEDVRSPYQDLYLVDSTTFVVYRSSVPDSIREYVTNMPRIKLLAKLKHYNE